MRGSGSGSGGAAGEGAAEAPARERQQQQQRVVNGREEGDAGAAVDGGAAAAPYDEAAEVSSPSPPPLPSPTPLFHSSPPPPAGDLAAAPRPRLDSRPDSLPRAGGRPRLDSRDSRRSFALYGPRVSSREGRPDHLASVLGQLLHDSPRGYSSSSAAPAAAAGGEDDDDLEAQQLAASPLRRPAPIEERGESLAAREEEEERGDDGGLDDDDRIAAAAASFSSSAAAAPKPPTPSLAQKQKKQRLYERISVLAPQDPSKLVQVNLRDVSYHVPVQLDKHTKTTVVNQSVCYFAYEFFRRLASLCRRGGGGCPGFGGPRGGGGGGGGDRDGDGAPAKYQVRDVASLFVPYESRRVLSGINLVLKPGKTYVVLGPPGSGKTSLLQAVSGRLPNRKSSLTGKPVQGRPHVTGRIEYNGVSVEDDPGMSLPDVVTYVGQLDVHAPYLTVRETFEFAYQSRNGLGGAGQGGDASASAASPRRAKASENLTIEGLGLDICQDTFVGNTNVRGISGGQRRRVSVGEMMQGQNPVACCDEISTGLDAAVTHEIVESIVNYSKAVLTTRIVSLLQPGPKTFALFDEVVVLCEGRIAYAGPVPDAVPYFNGLGYALPATVDAADFLQSVTTADGALLFDPLQSPRDEHYTPDEFAEAFAESEHGRRILRQLDAPAFSDWKRSGVPDLYKKPYPNGWGRSFRLNFRRHLTLWWRDKGFIIGKAAENIGMAVATGGILFGRAVIPAELAGATTAAGWTSADAVALQSLQDGVYSALFMTCLHILLGTTTSAPDDLEGRPIHYKHGDASFYQTSAYLLGKLAASLPQRTIEICSFGIPLYWMVGLDPTAGSFFLYLVIVLTYTFTLKILYAIFAQLLPNQQNVLSFGTFMVLLFGLFSGFIVYPAVIPNYYIWFYYANPVAWALQSLLLTEFTSSKYIPGAANALMGGRGFHTSRAWIGYNFVFFIPYALLCSAILIFVLKKVRIEPVRAGNGAKAKLLDDEDEEEESKDFNFPFIPVDLTFEDICYSVKASTGHEMLKLLNSVSGVMKGGRMCALMGSSGAGKTTLMDVISLRKTSGVIEGEVRLNGFLQERVSFLRSSGYVEQFDVQQAELTVRETVVFSARLRLSRDNPVTATDRGRLKFVDYVLEMMELTDIAQLQVGSYELGGLTFEQRKRLAIAVELAASPSVVFLDEPTSGLDSRGALVIMRAMKKIADTGRTVCATIHQPSAAVFEMFDDLLLLKRGGEVVFFGELGEESCDLVEYFESRGAKPIEHGENPAAWMLTAYTKDDPHDADGNGSASGNGNGSGAPSKDWKEEFEQSKQYMTMKETIAEIKANPDESKKLSFDKVFAASRYTREVLMMRRTFRIMMRSPSYNLARIMLAIVYSLILGTVFLGTQNRQKVFSENMVDGILSTIFLAMTIIGVVSVSMAVPVMKQIRDVFYKHRASGMLDHQSVSLSAAVGELPFIVIMSAIFCSIYYSLVGLFQAADKWFMFFLWFALNIATYTYFGQAFICMVRDIPTASALVGALIGFNVFFSGLVVRPQYFVGVFQIGFWTAPGRFVYEGVIVSQFIGLEYPVTATPYSPFWFSRGCTDPDATCTGTMEDYVNFFFGGKFSRAHQPIDLGVTFFCLFLARFALFVSLKYLNYVNT